MDIAAIRNRILTGSAVGFLRIGLAIPVYLLLTPKLLNALGLERFGLWSFNATILSVMNLVDFGLKNSLVYHVANHRSDRESVVGHFSAAVLSYLVIGTLVSLVAMVGSKQIVESIMQVPKSLLDEAQFLLIATVVAVAVRMLSLPYQAVLEGYQEYARSQSVLVLWLLAFAACIAIALLVQPDIYGLSIASLVSNAVILAGFYVLATRRLTFLRLDRSCVRITMLGGLLKYGAGLQLAAVAIAIREPVYKIILARRYDLSTVAAFEIAFRLCTQMASLITTPLLGVLSVSALLSGRHDELTRILRPLFVYGMVVLLPAALFVQSFSYPFFVLWLGEGGTLAAQLFPGFFFGFAAYYSTEVLYKSIEGSGRSWYSGTLQTTVLSLQVALLLGLVVSVSSVVGSLVVGFVLFSMVNLILFKYYYKSITLVRVRQASAVVFPSATFLFLFPFLVDKWKVPIFILYLAVHILVIRIEGLVEPRVLLGFFGSMKKT